MEIKSQHKEKRKAGEQKTLVIRCPVVNLLSTVNIAHTSILQTINV